MEEEREGEKRKAILNNRLLTKIKQDDLRNSTVDFKNQKLPHQPQYAL